MNKETTMEEYILLEEIKKLKKEIEFVNKVVIPDYEKVQIELQMYQKALYKACEILEEGYGQEYASFIYMKNLYEVIEIPNNMTTSQWKEWLLKDE